MHTSCHSFLFLATQPFLPRHLTASFSCFTGPKDDKGKVAKVQYYPGTDKPKVSRSAGYERWVATPPAEHVAVQHAMHKSVELAECYRDLK